jgi:serine/threonine protein kinase
MAEHSPDSTGQPVEGEASPHAGRRPSPGKPAAAAQLREAAPAYEDLEARRARAGVAAALFGGGADEPERVAVGRYEIDSKLGSGGMGVVYRAHDPDLDRPVAVKLLHGESSDDDKARARMLREARALAKLSHPNVITVYDVGTDDGQVFVAMELVAGRDLRRWLDDHGSDHHGAAWRQVLELFIAAGRGLEAAHEVALVHRDFKPENVLVGDDGRVRVLDFGLARVHRPVDGPTSEDAPRGGVASNVAATGEGAGGHDISHMATAALAMGAIATGALAGGLTETGALIGTPLYMAPELYAGKPADVRSDQFAFCASLYEGLYRQLPFGSRNLVAHVEAVRSGRAIEPPMDSSVPAGIWKVIARGLDPDPNARWRSIAALLAELERVAAEPALAVLPQSRGGLRWWAIAGVVVVAAGGWAGLELGWFGERAEAQPAAVAAVVVDPPESIATPRDVTPSESGESGMSGEPGMTTTEKLEPADPIPDPTQPLGTADPITAEGETGETGETGEAAAPTPAPASELHGWCHLHEDRYTLLARTDKRKATLEHRGSCYTCRVESRRDRTRNFSPRDCAGYALCGKASADACG